MRTFLRSALALILASGTAFAAAVAAPTALPPSAITAAFGAGVGAQVLAATNGISLRSAALTLSSLDQFRAAYPAITNPEQKAAATAVLAALSAAPADLPAKLAATDLPKAAAARIQKIAAKLDAAGKKDAKVAAKIAANRASDAAMAAQAISHPENVLPADLVATFRAFMDSGKDVDAAAAIPAAPVSATPVSAAPVSAAPVSAAPDSSASTPLPAKVSANILKSLSANFKALLAKRPNITFGTASLPIVAMPQIGDNFADLWTKTADQADSMLVAAYNFDDMDMAKSIVEGIKAGKKVTFVGDYSNWFPEPSGSGHGKDPRTPAMNYLLANANSNLSLYILQGLGGVSGINHNKFTVFFRAGKAIAQAGSFNYTKTSQDNHFENFGYTDDADRVKFFTDFHGWLVRRARPFAEGLKPQEPTFPANDPIPVAASMVSKDVPLPKQVGTPKSEAGAWYIKFYEQAKQDVMIAMFAMFPTPAEVAAIETHLAAGIPVNAIVDRGQVERAGALWGLIQKGMKLKIMAGPEQVIYGIPANAEHSKLHMKFVGIDGGRVVKGVDSLNDSNNAENHNFENLGFWDGYIAEFLYTYVKEVMWPLASEPSKQLLAKLQAEFEHSQQTAPKSSPKNKPAASANGPVAENSAQPAPAKKRKTPAKTAS
ncbi:MAG: phospholipase D-like domain-containing protein [Elusimicrobiota bacterium]